MTSEIPTFYDDLIWACSNLCSVLESENEALTHHNIETVHGLANNKVALARYYEQAMQTLSSEPELTQSLTPEQKDDLIAWGETLKALVESNMTLLKVEIEAGRYLMDAVVDVARKTAPAPVHYSAEGVLDKGATNEADSLAFNKVL